jgi:hypothetical protein
VDRRKLDHTFRTLQAKGQMYLDENGQPWLMVGTGAELRRVGMSAGNVFSPESDRTLAMQVLLARTSALLFAKSNHRELWPEFQADWALLQHAQLQLPAHGSHPAIATRASRQ